MAASTMQKHISRLHVFRERSVVFAIALLCILAIVSSLDGLLTLLSINPPPQPVEAQPLAWLLFLLQCLPLLLVVCLLQTLLVKALYGAISAWFKAVERKRYVFGGLISSAWLLIYLFIMSLSVFFSYQFYYERMSADVFAKDTYQQAVDDILSNTQQFGRQFDDAAKELDRLAQISSTLKAEENAHGGTCGGLAWRGCGSVCSLRETEATEFAHHSKRLNQLDQDLQAKIAEILLAGKNFQVKNFANDAAQLKKLVGDANYLLASSSDMLVLKRALAERKNRASLSAIRQLPTGGSKTLSGIDCSSEKPPQIKPGIEQAEASLSRITPITVPPLFNANDRQAVLGRAFEVFKSFFVSSETGKTSKPTHISNLDRMPIVIGVAVDLLIFFLGFIDELSTFGLFKKTDLSYISNDYEGKFFTAKEVRLIKLAMQHRGISPQDFFTAFNPFNWAMNAHDRQFIIPSNFHILASSQRKVLACFEELFKNQPRFGIVLLHSDVSAPELPIDAIHKKQLITALEGVDSQWQPDDLLFNVYHASTAAWNELQLIWQYSGSTEWVDLTQEESSKKIEDLTSDRNALSAALQAAREDVSQAKAITDNFAAYRQNLQTIETDSEDFQLRWREAKPQIDKMMGEINLLGTMTANIEKLERQLLQAKNAQQQSEIEVQQLLDKQLALQTTSKNLERTFEKVDYFNTRAEQSLHKAQALEKTLNETQSLLMAEQGKRQDLETQLEETQQTIDLYQQRRQDDLRKISDSQADLFAELNALRQGTLDLSSQYSDLAFEVRGKLADMDSAKTGLTEMVQQFERSQKDFIDKEKRELAELKAKNDRISREYERWNSEYNRIKASIELDKTYREELDTAQQKIGELLETLDRNQRSIESAAATVQRNQDTLARSNKNLNSTQILNKDYQQKLELLNAEVREKEADFARREQELSDLFAKFAEQAEKRAHDNEFLKHTLVTIHEMLGESAKSNAHDAV